MVKVSFMMQIRVVTSSSDNFLFAPRVHLLIPVQSFTLKITVTTHCKKQAAAVLRLLLLLSVMFRV